LNEGIRVPQVRLIGSAGEQVGVVATDEALRMAKEAELDLVEVAPGAEPPVCRIMDYGKYLFEKKKKTKKAKVHTSGMKEIKLRPKIGEHDYNFKNRHIERFLKDGDKVKVTITFRGREMDFTDRGRVILVRMAEEHKEHCVIERDPKLEGRNMIMILAPSRQR
jgi:translation initiation factor IF-3